MFTLAEKLKWELLQTKYPSPKCKACNQENETEVHFWKESCKGREKTRKRIEEKVKKKNRARKVNEKTTEKWINDLWEIECKEHHRNKELETLRKTTKWEIRISVTTPNDAF